MNKSIILGLSATIISLSAFFAHAQSDTQYPAANFQPKVIFIDEAAAKHAGGASAASAASTSATSATTNGRTPPDPKYPAAAFEPKVIFPG